MAMAAVLAWMRGTAPAPMLRGAAPEKTRTALVTSMGYYGNASALVMRRPPHA
jgi:3-oxoacyl-[acyl-carrier-protein] synthase II